MGTSGFLGWFTTEGGQRRRLLIRTAEVLLLVMLLVSCRERGISNTSQNNDEPPPLDKKIPAPNTTPEGNITGIQQIDLFDDTSARDVRHTELLNDLRELGCHETNPRRYLHRFTCGTLTVEVSVVLPKQLSLTAGTTAWFDCDYAGRGQESPFGIERKRK